MSHNLEGIGDMGYRSTSALDRSHLRLVDGGAPAPLRPGQRMALRIARLREERIQAADRAIRDAWIVGTHDLPGRANRAIEDFRRARRSPWRGQLEGITQALERAAQMGPEELERRAELLRIAYGLYLTLIEDTRDELLAEMRPSPTPSAPALARAA